MDRSKMAEGVRLFLEGIDRQFAGDDQQRTPERVARAWVEDLLSGYDVDPAAELTFTEAPKGAPVVAVRQIRFASICVHHLLPFSGFAQVVYLPAERLAGLSKIGRVVDAHARQMQTQEHLTAAILSTLEQVLEPRGVAVQLEAEHTCMTLRGVRKEQSRMMTVATAGLFEQDPVRRREALDLLSARGSRD